MKSKLAVWSWILPVIGYGIYITSTFVRVIPGDQVIVDVILTILLILGSTLLGLIFGIDALREMSKNPQLSGKGHAIVGIILNPLLFIYGIVFLLLGGLMGI